MEPSTVTPSANLKIAPNMEHAEARQAAIDRERAAFIATLDPETQTRFAAIEQAVLLLKDVKIPFFLFVRPEPTHSDRNRAGIWHHQMAHYGDPFSSEEHRKEVSDTLYQTLVIAADYFGRALGLTVPICGPDGHIYHMANPPARPFSPPPDDCQPPIL